MDTLTLVGITFVLIAALCVLFAVLWEKFVELRDEVAHLYELLEEIDASDSA